MKRPIPGYLARYIAEEHGGVTVAWLTLTASVAAIAMSAFVLVASGVGDLAHETTQTVVALNIRADAPAPGAAADATDAGGGGAEAASYRVDGVGWHGGDGPGALGGPIAN